MLKDNIGNLSKYICLDDDISLFSLEKGSEVTPFSSFIVDRKKTSIFYVEEGEANFATSWRENENNREILAVMNAKKGEFVLYLPGEPFAFRPLCGAEVKMWRAK